MRIRTLRTALLAAMALRLTTGEVEAGDAAAAAPVFPLRVSENSRHLVDQAGKPFLYHADTPWFIHLKLNREQTAKYLDARRALGFTAIQTMALPEGLKAQDRNPEGNAPFTVPGDFSTPNAAYFDYIEWGIRAASERGMLVAMNPAWLGCCDGGWRDLMKTNGVDKCRAYGKFLGQRFRSLNNLVWIHGGDRDPGPYIDEVRAIAEGIHEFAPHQLATVHAASTHSSLDVFPREPWLQLNATYTYAAEHVGAWRRQFHVYRNAKLDYLRRPPMPFFLIESTYEREHKASAQKIRRQAYWAYLSGACGHGMGNGLIWPMRDGWEAELQSPASLQMSHLATLLREVEWYRLVPDFDHRALVAGYGTFNDTDQPGGDDYVAAAVHADGTFLVAYLPQGGSVTVDLARISGPVRAAWFDPVSGASLQFEANLPNRGKRELTAPEKNSGDDRDWVLLLSPK